LSAGPDPVAAARDPVAGRAQTLLRAGRDPATMQRVEHVLLTRRLALRRFTVADVGNLLALDGDPDVMRFIGRTANSRAEIESRVLPWLLGSYAKDGRFGVWAADTRADGAFVGWFGLRPVVPSCAAMVAWADGPPDSPAAELGYRLRRAAWGRGYATEGARALVDRTFTGPGVDEVVATTMAVNIGSRRVMEKAGLRYVRTVYLDWPEPLEGNEHGDVEYRLTRADWAR
jgi:RimJ/RimL family protein N-acetyltransferase